MRRHLVTVWILSGFVLTLPLWAQGAGHGAHHGHYFDPTTITTLAGELEAPAGEWRLSGHGNHTGGGLHFVLAADDGESYELMLGPAWFVEDNGLALAAGDRVTVTGSIVPPYTGRPCGGCGAAAGDFLIATVLVADGVTLELRDDEGYPVWRDGPGGNGPMWFDADSVVTLQGTLTQELGFWSTWGAGNHTGSGMHYLFESSAGETFYAMLGPWWYLEDHGVELEKGLALEITGSVVDAYWPRYDDHRYLIATAVVVGDVRVELRDDDGYPLWRGTGWHYYAPAYQQASVGTFNGVVQRTQTRSYGQNLDPGYEMVFRAGGRRYVVFVAPQWYTEMRRFAVANGQQIEVRGSLVRDYRGRLAIVAREVVADGHTWRFRNARGNPTWMSGAF